MKAWKYLLLLPFFVSLGPPGKKEINPFYEKYGYVLPSEMKRVSQSKLEKTFQFQDVFGNDSEKISIERMREYLLFEKRVIEMANKLDYKEIVERGLNLEETMVYSSMVLKYEKDIDNFGKSDYHASFRKIHESKKDDCDGAATAAAALSGFPPYYMFIKGKKENEVASHAIFVYKTDKGKYGSISCNWSENEYPVHESIKGILKEVEKSTRLKVEKYEIYDLSVQFPDFIDNEKDNDPRTAVTKTLDWSILPKNF